MHTHSMRLASGQEALVTRVLMQDGTAHFGFSLQLDATEARHMALFQAGLRAERPRITPVMGHPWETAFISNSRIPWDCEEGFSRLQWLP
ncbi:MAG TPA: hypothetical protein VHG88_16750 [Burkholderiales bacterium]|nr:hypothetical protein [Burkholderiales bacterium]